MVTNFSYDQNTNLLSWTTDTPGEIFSIAYSIGDEKIYHIIYEGANMNCLFGCSGLATPIYANQVRIGEQGEMTPVFKEKIVD